MSNLNDNGRAAAALEISKAYATKHLIDLLTPPKDDPQRSTMTKDEDQDLDDMDIDADSDRCRSDEDMAATSEQRKRLRRAKKTRQMQSDPSNAKQALKVVKVIETRPQPFDPDYLTKCSFAPGTVKGLDLAKATTELSKRWNGDSWNRATPEQRRALVCKWIGSDVPLSRFLSKGPSQAVRPDPSLPIESDDTGPETQPRTAQGQVNDFMDQPVLRAPVEHVGGFTDSSLANSPFIGAPNRADPTDVTVQAIKMDWARRKQQMASAFANRPAAKE